MSVQPQTMYLKADWQEHVDFLDTMKQDVQNWERYCARFAAGSGEPPPNNIPDPEDVRAHGRHSDDPKHFEQLTRRTTSKKAKKLESLSTSLDGDDWHHFQVITGKATAPRKPPYGKTWMKQLFAGQMGLSILCVIAGMVIGAPLDVTSSNLAQRPAEGGPLLPGDHSTLGSLGKLEPIQLGTWWSTRHHD